MAADHQAPHRLLKDVFKYRLVGLRHLSVAEGDAGQLTLDQNDLVLEVEPALWLGDALLPVNLKPADPLVIGEW